MQRERESKWQKMRLDKRVGTRLRRALYVMPKNLDSTLKSDKEGILKISKPEMMWFNLHFR